jgi:hypothetical protein
MPYQVIFSPEALEQIASLYRYIARVNQTGGNSCPYRDQKVMNTKNQGKNRALTQKTYNSHRAVIWWQ